MTFAYADPPYLGQAKKHYSDDPKCAEVDHKNLIEEMMARYDGWALSLSSPTLQKILPMCPPGVRVGAWVKPFSSFKPNVNPAYAWEPVIFYGGRKRTRKMPTERDWIAASITLRKGMCGAKPKRFSFWVFEMLGMNESDILIDLFPGTGNVGQAHSQWRNWKLEKEKNVQDSIATAPRIDEYTD